MTWLMIEKGISLVLLSQHVTMEDCQIAKAEHEKNWKGNPVLTCVWLGYNVCIDDECRPVEVKKI